MVAQSRARLKAHDPVVWVRYDDGSAQEFALDRLRLADLCDSVPWRQVRSRHGQDHYSGSYASATMAGTARLVNVKPAARLADPKIAEALAWPGVLAERHGWEYEVWSGADVTVLENIRFLAGYRRPGVVPAGEVERAWACVRDDEQLADAELRLAGGRPRHEARPALLALLWSGRLATDLTRPLSGESVLRRPT